MPAAAYDGTAGLTPVPEITLRSGTYASCQERTMAHLSAPEDRYAILPRAFWRLSMLNWAKRSLLMAALFVSHNALSQEMSTTRKVDQCQSDAHEALIREAAQGLDEETVRSATERYCRRTTDCSTGDAAEYERCVSAYSYTKVPFRIPKASP